MSQNWLCFHLTTFIFIVLSFTILTLKGGENPRIDCNPEGFATTIFCYYYLQNTPLVPNYLTLFSKNRNKFNGTFSNPPNQEFKK